MGAMYSFVVRYFVYKCCEYVICILIMEEGDAFCVLGLPGGGDGEIMFVSSCQFI